eukprot:IDg2488t1
MIKEETGHWSISFYGRSQGPLVGLRCSYRPMLVFLPRAGRALATAHAISNTVAFLFIA